MGTVKGKKQISSDKPNISVGSKQQPKRYGEIYELIQTIQPEATEFLLPSRGLFYHDRVKIRAMTSKEEKRIAGINQRNWNATINGVLKACIKEPVDFNPEILTVGDRLTLITYLRITTYGPKYISEMTCPKCNNTTMEEYDLNKLEDIWLPEEFEEPEFVKLDSFDGGVYLRLMRISDEIEIENYIRKQKKFRSFSTQDEWSMRYAKTIVEIENAGQTIEANEKEKGDFFDSLPGNDSLKIRDFHAKYDHGINLNVSFACNNCGYENPNLTLNINASFFFPSRATELSK